MLNENRVHLDRAYGLRVHALNRPQRSASLSLGLPEGEVAIQPPGPTRCSR